MSRLKLCKKIDISQFYNDARKISCIFINSDKFLIVQHVMDHIAKLFNITKPFHLTINDNMYIPPMETVCILEDVDTIFVVPDTGFDESPEVNTRHHVLNVCSMARVIAMKSLKHSATQTADASDIAACFTQSPLREDAKSHDTNTEQADQANTEADDRADSCTEKIRSASSKKRIRKRKRKAQIDSILDISNGSCTVNQPVTQKPLHNSSITSKHIKFEIEDETYEMNKDNREEVQENELCPGQSVVSNDLATLLALRQNSIPLTFVNKKIKKEVDNVLDESASKNTVCDEVGQDKDNLKSLSSDYSNYPLITDAPVLNDLIAFKMLKIGANYMPEISDYIVGKVIACDAESSTYTIHVIKGFQEIQVPVGKFTMPGHETVTNVITINYNQMRELRLIS